MVPRAAALTQRCSSTWYAVPKRSTKPGVICPPRRPSVDVATRFWSRPIMALPRSPTASVRTSYAIPERTKISSVTSWPAAVSKTTSIGSWVPSGAASVAAPASTWTLVISLSNRKRVTSTSCTTESLIMNSELK